MRRVLLWLGALVVIALAAFAWSARDTLRGIAPLVQPTPPLSTSTLPFIVPAGFRADLYSAETPGARVMIRDPLGALLVSLTDDGSVVALPDENGDGKADAVYEVIKDLDKPHGLAFVCDEMGANCMLYIAEVGAVRSYTYDAATRTATHSEKVADLPDGGGHSSRTLHLHPDGKRLLIAVGSSCNVCEERDTRRASILQLNLQSGEVIRFASGLRNTVFMATHPVTGEIWGSDMGRDLLGDDLPPDEINIVKEGGWYGWPWFFGKSVEDYNFSPNARPSFAQEAIPSHLDIPAHSAPLGIAFVPEDPPRLAGASGGEAGGWPEDMWHDLLVAYHGSWNRSVPTGYKIVRFDLDAEGNPTGTVTDFMTGFTDSNGTILGRPAGLLIEPGGTLFVSDDRAGAIYRIARF